MTAVIMAILFLLALGLFIMIAPAVAFIAFLAMIYYFSIGNTLYGILAFAAWGISMSLGSETGFVSFRKW